MYNLHLWMYNLQLIIVSPANVTRFRKETYIVTSCKKVPYTKLVKHIVVAFQPVAEVILMLFYLSISLQRGYTTVKGPLFRPLYIKNNPTIKTTFVSGPNWHITLDLSHALKKQITIKTAFS